MDCWVFLGNPGAGKGTVANCLAGKTLFASGLSFGSGKTSRAQIEVSNDILFIDTPGLADTVLQTQSATEITKALKIAASGPCKLFSFITLRSGRVSAEDVATVNAVVSSIAVSDVPFAIIVNHVQPEQYARIMAGGVEFQIVTASICSGSATTPFIYFVPELPQLNEEENACVEMPLPFVRFFRYDVPSFQFEPGMVQSVPVSTDAFQLLVSSTGTHRHVHQRQYGS